MSSLISIIISVSINLPSPIGRRRQVIAFWSERFCSALSISFRSRADRVVHLRLGLAPSVAAATFDVAGARRHRQVGWWSAIIFTLSLQTFLHAKAAVADMWLVLFVTLAHRAGYELLRDRLSPPADQTSNIKHQTSHWWWVFYLSLALDFLPRTNRMDPAVDCWIDNDFPARNAECPSIRFWPRASADALDRRTLGNSGTDSNAWTIFCRGNRSTRDRSLVCHDGRSWCGFIGDVSPAPAVLFRNDLFKFFPCR